MISKELEATLNLALKEAKTRRHEYVSLEHLLYALLRDKDGKAAIVACGGDIDRLNKSLEEFFNCFFFQAEDGIRDLYVTGVQTCALPISWLDAKLSGGGYAIVTAARRA